MHNEVKKLEEQTKATVTSGILGLTPSDVCEICHKTKFADGTGNKCHYCNKKSCARCGGNTSPKAGKVRWNLCVLLNSERVRLVCGWTQMIGASAIGDVISC